MSARCGIRARLRWGKTRVERENQTEQGIQGESGAVVQFVAVATSISTAAEVKAVHRTNGGEQQRLDKAQRKLALLSVVRFSALGTASTNDAPQPIQVLVQTRGGGIRTVRPGRPARRLHHYTR